MDHEHHRHPDADDTDQQFEHEAMHGRVPEAIEAESHTHHHAEPPAEEPEPRHP